MLQRPKKRSWPSLSCISWLKPRRQPPGDRKGRMPSMTSTSAIALQKASALTRVQRRGAAVLLPELRSAWKKSDDDGSTTSTSLFFAKLCL